MKQDFQTVDLRIEVKCSRKGRFHIKDRDLKGLTADQKTSFGYVATLITGIVHEGPHWVLVPADKVVPKSYNEKVLLSLKADLAFWRQIDCWWGDVLMDDELLDKLLQMPKIDFKSMAWWNQLSFKPQDIPQDAIRKIKVKEALDKLRQRLDKEHKKNGSRREGFLHQCILCYCLIKSGHDTVSNITGVPDLRIQLKN